MQCESIQHPSEVWLIAVLLIYLYFAVQVLYQTRWEWVDVRSAVAMGTLVLVFILCGLAHFSGLLPQRFYNVREGLYAVLVAAGITLVKTNQAGVISTMMEREYKP